jgi:soluble lytic murein transglycosylase-like protein
MMDAGRIYGRRSLPTGTALSGMKKLYLQLVTLLVATTTFAASPTATRTVYDATLRNGFTIHNIRHEAIGNNTRLYTNNDSYIDVPTAEITNMAESQEPIAPQVQLQPTMNQVVSAASDKHQIDPDLITSVIHAESAFNPKALSPKGAQGLMQLMPGTASRLGVTNAYDPAANVDGGTQYLRELLLKYNGDIIKALAAYNAGPGRVQQYHGVPPYPETRAYVARIVREFNQKKLAAMKAQSTSASAAAPSVASNNSSIIGK